MTRRHLSKITAGAVLIAASLAPAASPARDLAQRNALSGVQPVNVNVSFNIQMPMDSLDETSIVEAQMRGRALIYRLARDECKVLLEEIDADPAGTPDEPDLHQSGRQCTVRHQPEGGQCGLGPRRKNCG